MKNNMQDEQCEKCANTSILSATLIKEENTNNNVKIVVKPCDQHRSTELLEENVGHLRDTGLPIELVPVEQ